MDIADTIYSLAEEAPRAAGLPDRDDRSRLQPGAVGRGSLREICFLKRITPLGAVLCMEQSPKVGERLDLELLTGDRLRGCVEWVQDSDVGLRFDEAADMFALITRNLVHQTGDARRMPRIEIECPAWLEAGSRREIVTVRNLSDGGARITARMPLAVHEKLVLTLDGFRPAPAIVRWVQGHVAGIAFTPELPWQELMPWLRRRHRPKAGSAAGARASMTAPINVSVAPPAEAKDEIALNLAARIRDGSRRWSIEVESIDTTQIRFTSYAAVEPGRLFWITLPGLEGWPARVTEVDGYRVTCVFTQPLHPAVLQRVLASTSIV
jgi:hypothetical protein